MSEEQWDGVWIKGAFMDEVGGDEILNCRCVLVEAWTMLVVAKQCFQSVHADLLMYRCSSCQS